MLKANAPIVHERIGVFSIDLLQPTNKLQKEFDIQ
jgi:hypothetical protein